MAPKAHGCATDDLPTPPVGGTKSKLLPAIKSGPAPPSLQDHKEKPQNIPNASRKRTHGSPVPDHEASHASLSIHSGSTKVSFFEDMVGFKYEDLMNNSLVHVQQTGSRKKATITVDIRYVNTPGSKVQPGVEMKERFKLPNGQVAPDQVHPSKASINQDDIRQDSKAVDRVPLLDTVGKVPVQQPNAALEGKKPPDILAASESS